ncbi:MAG: Rieske (2Fe-2S) protein [Vulcanimicrobiaceae bacterium]
MHSVTVFVAGKHGLAPGATRPVVVGDVEVLLCTHDGSPLDQGELGGTVITHPCHGAQFDVTSGAVVALSAVKPIRTFPVLRRNARESRLSLARG